MLTHGRRPLFAAAMAVVIVVAVGAFATALAASRFFAEAEAFTAPDGVFYLATDCDTTAAGVQDECSLPAGTTSVDVGVVVGNETGVDVEFGSFDFVLRAVPQSVLNPAAAPSLNPALNANGADFDCDPPPLADREPGPQVAESFISCFSGAFTGPMLADGATVTLATLTYDVSAGGGHLDIGLSSVGDTSAIKIAGCAAVSASDLCFGAEIDVAHEPTATASATNTSVPTSTATPTSTPAPATATATSTFVPPTATATATNTNVPTSTATSTPTVAPAVMSLEPAAASVDQGDTTTIAVHVSGVENLGAFEFELSFDESVLDFVSVAEGPFLGSTGKTTTCPAAIIDTGSVRFGCGTFGSSEGPGGAGTVAFVTFEGDAPGASALTFTLAQLSDPFANSIAVSATGGTVTVHASTATATATETPPLPVTATPTATITPPLPVTNTPTPTITPPLPFTNTPTPTNTPVSEIFDLVVAIDPETAVIGQEFPVSAEIGNVFTNYQAVQWDIDYDESLVTIVAIQRDPAAPEGCVASNDNNQRVLLGCLDVTGANLTYAGTMWNVTARCIAEGLAPFTLQGVDVTSFVAIGTGQQDRRPVNVINDAIECVTALPGSPTPTRTATPVTGDAFDLTVGIAADTVDVGEEFTVDVAIENVFRDYQAVQWDVDYNNVLVDVVSITRDASAPVNCGSSNDNGTRVLLGCIDIFGANLSYEGVAWHVTARCEQEGIAPFILQGVNTTSFVALGNSPKDRAPINALSDVIDCVEPDTPTATATPTFTPAPGDAYDLAVAIAGASANVGDPFTVAASIGNVHAPYQAVQWDIDYDETLIDIVAMTKDGAAPDACTPNNDNGSRVLLGCIDLLGANVSYEGVAWNVTAECITEGTALFTLQGVNVSTFVRISPSTPAQPINVTNDLIECVAAPGEAYELFVEADRESALQGEPFTIDVGIGNVHANYAAVQWDIDYDESVLDVVSVEPAGLAPDACGSSSDSGARLLVGCFAPWPVISFEGVAWNVGAVCIAEGTGTITLQHVSSTTFVKFRVGPSEPITVIHDSIECTGGVATATATGTNTPALTPATSTNTPTVTNTPLPPTSTPTVTSTPTITPTFTPFPGDAYDLAVGVAPASALLGEPFTVAVSIGGVASPYQAVQWDVDYDEARIDIVSIGKAAGAPEACGSSSDNTFRVLLGCIDLLGANLTFEGVAWNIGAECIREGPAMFTLQGVNVSTFVRISPSTPPQPINVTNDVIECVAPEAETFELSAQIDEASANVGEQFVVDVGIGNVFTNYQAAQWDIDYDEAVVDIVAIAADADAAENCVNTHDNGTRVLLGCIDVFGPNLNYEGVAYRITAQCIAGGLAPFTVQSIDVRSFVAIGTGSEDRVPITALNDAIECIGGLPSTVTPTPTVTATATSTPTSGEAYELSVAIDEVSANVDEPFVMDVAIGNVFQNYQSAQWDIDYDETLVDIVSIEPDAAAIANCGNMNDNGSRILLGCLDLFGVNLMYEGVAFHVTVRCIAGGAASFTLQGLNDTTHVSAGGAQDRQPINVTNDGITCVGETLTATPTPTITPTPAGTFTPTATHTPAQAEPYELGVKIDQESAAVGETVEGSLTIGNVVASYQAVQWNADYDETLVEVSSLAAGPEAPLNCGASNNNGFRLLTACFDLFRPSLTFEGEAWTFTARCLAPGTAQFSLVLLEGVHAQTFVRIGSGAAGNQAIVVVNDSIECLGDSTSTVTPTSTPTSTPTATATATSTPIPGDAFELSVEIDEDTANVDEPFLMDVAIGNVFANYQAVQWDIDYDDTLVEVVVITPEGAAPPECEYTNDNGSRVLVGCLDPLAPNLEYEGVAYTIKLRCIAPGHAPFTLQHTESGGGSAATTFVLTGATRESSQPIVVVNDSIECQGPAVTPTGTATPTSTVPPPTATPTLTPRPEVTRTMTPTPATEPEVTVTATRTVEPDVTRTVRATQTARVTRTAQPTETIEPTATPERACLTLGQKISLVIGIVRRWGAEEGGRGYKAKYDVTADGVIDGDDLEQVVETPTCRLAGGRGGRG